MIPFSWWFPVFLTLFIFAPQISTGEGTKQFEPIGPPSNVNGGLGLALYDGGSTSNGYRIPFAKVGCDTAFRLNIYIEDPSTEKIYFGFREQDGQAVYFRFRDPNGNIVPGFDLTAFPAAGNPGYINDWASAVSGPLVGYTPLILDPALTGGIPGNYYVEFAANPSGGNFGYGDSRVLDLFDISVVKSGSTIVDGRVWSQAWQFSNQIRREGGTGNTNAAPPTDLYFYSNDGITTKCNLNRWQGGHFYVNCNQWGVYRTGNWITDRKSIEYSDSDPIPVLPQYREFLNLPDETIFPTGTIGQICSGSLGSISYCDGSVDFIMKVTKTGIVTLNITTPSGTAIVQGEVTGYPDCSTFDTIHWDGLINGVPVQNGASLTMSIQYLNGLTNLPGNDIESCNNGIKVDIVRPTTGIMGIMWDDSNFGGSVNSTYPGCVYVPPNGCHTFTGEHRIVNSWWYYLTTGTESLNITTINTPSTPTLAPVGPNSVCQGQSGVTYTTTISSASLYEWYLDGLPIDTTSTPSVTLNFGNYFPSGNHTLSVRGYNIDCGFGGLSL